jgi:hypothetical protein
VSLKDGKLGRAELAERLRHFNMETYLATSDLLSGGVLAVAGVVALEIATGPREGLWRGVLWIASLLLFLASHVSWRLGGLLVGTRVSTGDYVNPMMIGLFELGQFLILSNQFKDLDIWAVWCGVTAGQLFFSAGLSHNRLVGLRLLSQYDADADAFVAAYRDWMISGRRFMGAMAIVFVVAASACVARPDVARIIAIAAAVLAMVISFGGISTAVRRQDQFLTLLTAEEPSDAS